jgi:iron complex outermembrane recepter protein
MQKRTVLQLVTLAMTCFAQASLGDTKTGDPSRSQNLEEVIVTAQKRAERVIDVPMSITALSGDALTAAQITNVRDLSYSVPSMAVFETGPGHQSISIRGVASSRGTSSLTGVYLDEMPVSGLQDDFFPAYADLRVIDLDRVEVLKGPQGTLFGEGAAGGVVRYLTRDPDLQHVGGELSTSFYNTADGDWSGEVGGVFNLPLVDDVFGIRVAAKYESLSGWIDQPSIGKEDINDSETKHVRVKALYAPSDNLRIRALAEIHRNDGGGSNIVNVEPHDSSNFLQAFDRSAPTDFWDRYDMFNLAVTYNFGSVELLSSSSYGESDAEQSFTQLVDSQPSPALEVLIRDYPNSSKTVSQEVRLASVGQGALSWTIGANYKDAELEAGFGPHGADGILLGNTPTPILLPGFFAGIRPTWTSTSWAGFADASYTFLGRIELGGGVRYFNDDRESYDVSVTPRTVQSATFSKTTYRAYAKYVLSPNANIYATVGTGFRSGGFNSPAVVAGGAPLKILPETTMLYELGAKAALLNGRLRLDVAAFRTEYQDMMASRLSTSPVTGLPVQYTANGQDAEVNGVELSANWAATDNLTLSLAGDVTDAEITEVDQSVQVRPVNVGDPIGVPEYSLSGAIDYSFEWFGAEGGLLRLAVSRKGKQEIVGRDNPFALPYTELASPEVTFVEASIGGEWSGWKWSLFGNNLLDEDNLLYPSFTGFSSQARPRTFGIAMSRTF